MSVKVLKKFKQYHADNPHIYQAFEKLALQAAQKRSKFSARAIFHILRWDSEIRGNGEFKICNDHSPYYARLFEAKNPKHKGFFRKRDILPPELDAVFDNLFRVD